MDLASLSCYRNIRDICDAIRLNLIPFRISEAKIENRLCDSCARGKSIKYIRRPAVKQNSLSKRGQILNSVKHKHSYDVDSEHPYYMYCVWEVEDEHALLTTSTVIAIAVSSARAISKAQPLSNTIFLVFTDIKGLFKVSGLDGEIFAQSFMEEETNLASYCCLIAQTERLN